MARLQFKTQSKEYLNNMQVLNADQDSVQKQQVIALVEIARQLDRIANAIEKPL